MTDVTLTSSAVTAGPITGDRAGLNVKHVKFQWAKDVGSPTLSVSVMLQLLPLPDGARLLDLVTMVSGQAGQVGSYVIGDGSSTNRYVTTLSLTASDIVSRATALGMRYSLTQSDYVTWETIDMKFQANVTSTRTLCVEMVAWYIMDRENEGEQ